MRGNIALLFRMLVIGIIIYSLTAHAEIDAPPVPASTTEPAPDSTSKTHPGPAEGTQHETFSSSGWPIRSIGSMLSTTVSRAENSILTLVLKVRYKMFNNSPP